MEEDFHQNPEIFSCKLCKFQSTKKIMLAAHVKMKHKNPSSHKYSNDRYLSQSRRPILRDRNAPIIVINLTEDDDEEVIVPSEEQPKNISSTITRDSEGEGDNTNSSLESPPNTNPFAIIRVKEEQQVTNTPMEEDQVNLDDKENMKSMTSAFQVSLSDTILSFKKVVQLKLAQQQSLKLVSEPLGPAQEIESSKVMEDPRSVPAEVKGGKRELCLEDRDLYELRPRKKRHVHKSDSPKDVQDIKVVEGRQPKTHNREKKSENKSRTFLCSYCNYQTIAASNLEIHERVHTGERPIDCPHCPHRFTQKTSMRNHVEHHKDSPKWSFRCHACTYGCLSLRALVYHISRAHDSDSGAKQKAKHGKI